MNYEQLKKDVHTLYLRGDLPQRMALKIMGFQPSTRWIVTKIHSAIHYLVKGILKDVAKNESN